MDPPSYFDYATEDTLSSPTYSPTASVTERNLSTLPCQHHSQCTGHNDFQFRTDHMQLNLGCRIWGLDKPSYGLQGTILGVLTFSGEAAHVEKVTVTFEGIIRTVTSERGNISGQTKVQLLSETRTVFSSSSSEGFNWKAKHTFSIPIPSEVNLRHGISPLPPTFAMFLPGTTCEVVYTLRLDMWRKGMRRHEVKKIPIIYLPKSRPSHLPLPEIPRSAVSISTVPYSTHERVKTIKLSPFWCSYLTRTSRSLSEKQPSTSVYLSIPYPASFTSGSKIPVMLTVTCCESPALVKLLCPRIRVDLIKRTRLWRNGGHEITVKDVPISVIEEWRVEESREGIYRTASFLPAGSEGREHSWSVDKVAEVQYFIRAVLHPPCSVANHIPTFRHEELVQLATDPWGTLARELSSTGGMPTPALGLCVGQRELLRMKFPDTVL